MDIYLKIAEIGLFDPKNETGDLKIIEFGLFDPKYETAVP